MFCLLKAGGNSLKRSVILKLAPLASHQASSRPVIYISRLPTYSSPSSALSIMFYLLQLRNPLCVSLSFTQLTLSSLQFCTSLLLYLNLASVLWSLSCSSCASWLQLLRVTCRQWVTTSFWFCFCLLPCTIALGSTEL